MTDLLFETPWWLPTFFLAVGAFVWWVGNNRQIERTRQMGMLIGFLGIAIALVSYAVETPREKAVRRTKELVAAADQHDWTKFKSLLDRQTNIYGVVGPDDITLMAQTTSDTYGLKSARILGMDTQKAASVIKISIRVMTEVGGQSGLTDWQLVYQDMGEGWKLYTVEALSNNQVSENDIKARLNRP